MTQKHNFYITSDWHCHHKNVIEFDQRPFTDLDHMHRVLINNYNACLHDYATCYFLGDFSMGSIEQTRDIVSQLKGTKILILGNHDRNAPAMTRAGFDAVLYMASVVVGGKLVTMTHCPLRGIPREDVTGMRGAQPGDNWYGEQKHKNFSIPDWGQYHLHGHCHKKPEEKTLDRQWDVGVRANKYMPVSSSQLESWITLREKV